MYYRGRDMALAHRGMRISDSDWNVFLGHAVASERLISRNVVRA
jgi:hemoglobin